MCFNLKLWFSLGIQTLCILLLSLFSSANGARHWFSPWSGSFCPCRQAHATTSFWPGKNAFFSHNLSYYVVTYFNLCSLVWYLISPAWPHAHLSVPPFPRPTAPITPSPTTTPPTKISVRITPITTPERIRPNIWSVGKVLPPKRLLLLRLTRKVLSPLMIYFHANFEVAI